MDLCQPFFSQLCQCDPELHISHSCVCCTCLQSTYLRSGCCRCSFIFILCCADYCFSITLLPSFIDVCLVFVLLCSIFSCILHPLWAACTCGPFVFSAVPVPPPPGVNIEEHIQIRQEEKRQRINRRHRLEEGRGMDQS